VYIYYIEREKERKKCIEICVYMRKKFIEIYVYMLYREREREKEMYRDICGDRRRKGKRNRERQQCIDIYRESTY